MFPYFRNDKASKGFGLKASRSAGAASSKPVVSLAPKTAAPAKENSPKKRPATSTTANPPKKLKTFSEASSTVAAGFEKHALLHINRKELDSWKARSKEESRDVIRRATAELFFHNVVDESMKDDDLARSHTLEIEKKVLMKEMKENKKALDSLSNEKSVLEDSLKIHSQEEARLKRTLLEKENLPLECKKENDLFSLENIQLKTDQPLLCQKEREQLQGAAYEDGFRGYVLGFLATDPRYSWEKFDPDTRKWIYEFKAENGPVIAAKKVEIEAELARLNPDAAPIETPIQVTVPEARPEDEPEKGKSPTTHPEYNV